MVGELLSAAKAILREHGEDLIRRVFEPETAKWRAEQCKRCAGDPASRAGDFIELVTLIEYDVYADSDVGTGPGWYAMCAIQICLLAESAVGSASCGNTDAERRWLWAESIARMIESVCRDAPEPLPRLASEVLVEWRRIESLAAYKQMLSRCLASRQWGE